MKTENDETYLSSEINSYKEDVELYKNKINSVKFGFAKTITNGLGKEIKKELEDDSLLKEKKNKNKFKEFFNKILNIYG